jgi:hypothetical protein
MGHSVDGFDLKFTSRTSWKAQRRNRGKLVDVVPVTWVHSQRREGKSILQGVHYQDPVEMERARLSREPFIIALAIAKDPQADPKVFHEFRGVFEVESTGAFLGGHTIETRVLRRIKAGKEN